MHRLDEPSAFAKASADKRFPAKGDEGGYLAPPTANG